ncbi:hypothetical protein SUDANB176_03579 [Streptomyces sp. enrichment culture]|uniref:HGxxPAAW family protein n=1 Tax=Streptomyces sp. enrichment culture TaxID=1795815 RepID=UPI003F57FA43
MSAHPYDHGHTVAGWTGVGIVSAGTAVLGLGVGTVSRALLAGGLGIVVAGLLVTWALHLAGWGKPSGPRPREQWDWRVRDLGARQGHPGCLGCRLAGRGRRPAAAGQEHGRASVPASRTGGSGAGGTGDMGPVGAGESVR